MSKKTCMVMGLGGMGRGWLKNIRKHPDWECIGIIDTDTELLSNLGSFGFDDSQGFTTIDEAVAAGTKPDMVVVATPIYTHHSLVREIMEYNINVICEKNMAGDLYQAKQMVAEALKRPQLCTAVGTQYRYGRAEWTARNFIQDPECMIGKLGVIKWESSDYRGEKRFGWRRWLQDVYLEDMSVHWFDLLRYITGMDIIQVRADCFMPRYSEWHGSSEVMAQLALAKKEDWNDRHNWVWCDFYGGWQRRGPTGNDYVFYGSDGQATYNAPYGMAVKKYIDPNNHTKFEEDGYLPVSDVENLGTDLEGDSIILEMMSRGIDSNGEKQPGTNFKEAFRSFAVSVAANESSRYGTTVWVPNYWKDWLEY